MLHKLYLMTKKVRVRFAPSPTGPLHIGGVRTALFNYLFAKKHGGDFILRIEDTDQTRYVAGAEDYIVNALNWCKIPFDEGPGKEGDFGPYRQSERKAVYADYATQLITSGNAYYAFDTPETLNDLRASLEKEGQTFSYGSANRDTLNNSLTLTESEVAEKLANDTPYVIRFKTPANETLLLTDRIRGNMKIDTNTLDDKVLFKSDGMPTYHLANIVDDHLMKISHVIRGEEWLPSLALHQQLYTAFGWQAPEFAHLPLIMKPVGKGKLSKRDGDKLGFPVFPLSWNESVGYKEAGFYPEAVINFLALLGWNSGTEQELFSLEELVAQFSLERVNKSGARFDPEKNKWYNQHYLQQQENASIAKDLAPIIEEKAPNFSHANKLHFITQVVGLTKERAAFVPELFNLSSYFFIAPTEYAEKPVKKQWKEGTAAILSEVKALLASIDPFTSEETEAKVKAWIASKELSFGAVMPPLRLVLVGDMKGPHVFDIIALLGKEETISRITKAIAILG